MGTECVLEMQDISKEFPGVKALNNVSLKIAPGKVHVLIGENGAGKSTLMKILMGLYKADTGKIILRGKELVYANVGSVIKAGISMIHQELTYIPYMSVADNIFLVSDSKKASLAPLKKKKIYSQTREILSRINLQIDPRTLMKDLRVAEKQMVEIAKAVSFGSQIIIMDEPTSALTVQEVDKLFSIIDELKSKNVAVIFISHKIEEVKRIGDVISILRDGELVGTYDINEIDTDKIIYLMVGREIRTVFPTKNAQIGEEMLSVKHLTRKGVFNDISFHVNRGEILGVAGLMGSGRTELVRSICGIDPYNGGDIYFKGKKTRIKSPTDAIKLGIGLVNEDRKGIGLILEMSVRKNLTLSNLDLYFNAYHINSKKEKAISSEIIKKLNIKTPGGEQLVNYLSGGNQQKVVVGKLLLNKSDVLIMDEPTRGIDVGAKAEMYKLIVSLAANGKSVILVSSEMPELLGLSDRIIVFHEGRMTGELLREEFSQEKVMKLALS